MAIKNLTAAREANSQLIKEFEEKSGVTLSDCYQCGKCTAGCPVAFDMDIVPRQVIRDLQLGLVDEVLHAKSPWMCATCNTCVSRCPQSVDLPSLMEVIRQEAKARKICPIKEVDKFNDLFLDNVERFGKSHEMILSGLYNLETGHLFQDVPNAPHMYFKKMIRIRPHMSEDRKEIKKMMRKVRYGGAK